jgi:sugar-specific transcriptional regulator TrmB
MIHLSEEEKRILLALSELEPASLEQVSRRSGVDAQKVKWILAGLAKKGLLAEMGEDEASAD